MKYREEIHNYIQTHAGHLPCAVEIGTSLYQCREFYLPDGHGGAHQPDEYISIEGFLKAIELTVLMLLECDKSCKD